MVFLPEWFFKRDFLPRVFMVFLPEWFMVFLPGYFNVILSTRDILAWFPALVVLTWFIILQHELSLMSVWLSRQILIKKSIIDKQKFILPSYFTFLFYLLIYLLILPSYFTFLIRPSIKIKMEVK